MAVTLDSVQIGSPKPSAAGSLSTTAIDKQSVDSVRVELSGLVGDTIVDQKNHGGPDQAVYLYTRDDYGVWEALLDRPLPGGTFGENLTISGFSSADMAVGDRFHVGGEVVLEATSARIPCAVFQEHLQEADWVKRFRDERIPGIYCRVVRTGDVRAGDAVRVEQGDSGVTILETQDLYYDRGADESRIRAALAAPIAVRSRVHLEQRLERRT